MLLDAGLCTVCTRGSRVGDPLTEGSSCWYGDLDYGSSPANGEYRIDEAVERRIRILQDRTLTALHAIKIDGDVYEIMRVYHGTDDESGQRISDLTLRRIDTGVM